MWGDHLDSYRSGDLCLSSIGGQKEKLLPLWIQIEKSCQMIGVGTTAVSLGEDLPVFPEEGAIRHHEGDMCDKGLGGLGRDIFTRGNRVNFRFQEKGAYHFIRLLDRFSVSPRSGLLEKDGNQDGGIDVESFHSRP